ncbi:hypothetical protein M899_1160 [Bacteriovorax sp. BSW11_IV]|nr:hypothetical protein M899_1160 [Bacteriovorax sp. BSW11_IV]
MKWHLVGLILSWPGPWIRSCTNLNYRPKTDVAKEMNMKMIVSLVQQ